MTTPYTDFQVAGLSFPLPSGGTLYDVDPVLAYSLDYWKWLIETYAGNYIVASALAGGRVSETITEAVAQVYPDDPSPYLTSQEFCLPCLAAYRKDSTYKRKTAGWSDDRVTFDLLYILPPLMPSQAATLLPARRAIEAIIREKTVQGFDPGFAPRNGTLGASPFGLAFAGVEEIGFTNGHYSAFPSTGNLVLPMLHMEGYFVERDMPMTGLTKFAGGDVTVSVDGLSPVVQVATQQAPTLASLSVTSGTIAGGTAVTLTGTLFLTGPVVLFGTTPAKSVVWNSATSITCVAPPSSELGAVDVSVTNRDGQTSGPVAFTYVP